MIINRFILAALLWVLAGFVPAQAVADSQEGEASYYADSLHGNKTASGELYDKNGFSAAHRTLPFGTKVRVTYLKTGKSVELVINDRGPYAKDRILDVSGAAAIALGLMDAGHGRVQLETVEP